MLSKNIQSGIVILLFAAVGKGYADVQALHVAQLTRGNANDTEAAWSPDGKSVAFERREGTEMRIARVELASGEVRVLAGDATHRACYPAWMPDGSIVYCLCDCSQTGRKAFDTKSDTGCNLRLLLPHGGNRELTRGRWHDYTPMAAPDGSAVYFATTRGQTQGKGSGATRLAKVTLATNAEPQIIRAYLDKGTEIGGVSPVLSPDGETLAWAEIGGWAQYWRILAAPLTNLAATAYLTEETMCAYAPKWSPDGRWIVCTGCRTNDPAWSVYLIDMRTKVVSRLDTGLGKSKSPAWSPDGKRLVFENDRTGVYQLYTCELAFDAPTPQKTAPQKKPFEVIARVDHYDFYFVPGMDMETKESCAKILDEVLTTGATTVSWRPRSGGLMRYHSREEAGACPPVRDAMDKRRLPRSAAPILDWECLNESQDDLLDAFRAETKARGAQFSIDWTCDENHWCNWSYGAWSWEHPECWCRSRDGKWWAGRCSLAYPAFMEHKLRYTDELISRKPDMILIDNWRNGGWSPAKEFVPPEIARWENRYHTPPPENLSNPRWCAFVAERTSAFFTAVRGKITASGQPIRLVVGTATMKKVDGSPDETLCRYGVDWKWLVDQRIVDGLYVKDVRFDPKRAFESTAETYQSIADYCKGKCKVYFAVEAYDFAKAGMPSYQRATGLTQPEVAARLIELAKAAGGDGVILEVVDYHNYQPATCALLKASVQK